MTQQISHFKEDFMEDYKAVVSPRQMFFENLCKEIKKASNYYELEDFIDKQTDGTDLLTAVDKTFLHYITTRFIHQGFEFKDDKFEIITFIYAHINSIAKGSI